LNLSNLKLERCKPIKVAQGLQNEHELIMEKKGIKKRLLLEG